MDRQPLETTSLPQRPWKRHTEWCSSIPNAMLDRGFSLSHNGGDTATAFCKDTTLLILWHVVAKTFEAPDRPGSNLILDVFGLRRVCRTWYFILFQAWPLVHKWAFEHLHALAQRKRDWSLTTGLDLVGGTGLRSCNRKQRSLMHAARKHVLDGLRELCRPVLKQMFLHGQARLRVHASRTHFLPIPTLHGFAAYISEDLGRTVRSLERRDAATLRAEVTEAIFRNRDWQMLDISPDHDRSLDGYLKLVELDTMPPVLALSSEEPVSYHKTFDVVHERTAFNAGTWNARISVVSKRLQCAQGRDKIFLQSAPSAEWTLCDAAHPPPPYGFILPFRKFETVDSTWMFSRTQTREMMLACSSIDEIVHSPLVQSTVTASVALETMYPAAQAAYTYVGNNDDKFLESPLAQEHADPMEHDYSYYDMRFENLLTQEERAQQSNKRARLFYKKALIGNLFFEPDFVPIIWSLTNFDMEKKKMGFAKATVETLARGHGPSAQPGSTPARSVCRRSGAAARNPRRGPGPSSTPAR